MVYNLEFVQGDTLTRTNLIVKLESLICVHVDTSIDFRKKGVSRVIFDNCLLLSSPLGVLPSSGGQTVLLKITHGVAGNVFSLGVAKLGNLLENIPDESVYGLLLDKVIVCFDKGKVSFFEQQELEVYDEPWEADSHMTPYHLMQTPWEAEASHTSWEALACTLLRHVATVTQTLENRK